MTANFDSGAEIESEGGLMEAMHNHGSALDESIAALRLDRNGRIVEATDEAASVLGFTPEALHSLTLGDLAADRWREMADAATARILCGDTRSFQLMLRGRSGRRTLLQMVSRRVVQGDATSYVLAWSEQFHQPSARSAGADAQELRRLANGLLRNWEGERSRVATELHGGVAPLVVTAKFIVEDAIRRIAGGAYAEGIELLNGAIGRLREVLDEVRRISTELRPSMLDDLGLLPTIEWICRNFEETYRSIRVERQFVVTEADVPEQLKLEIFRIIEEALTNVAQHSHASQVRVAFAREADDLLLWVQDDGDGFDPAVAGRGPHQLRGIGLPSIRKRVEATNGRLAVESMPGMGARISASWTLPVRATNQ